MDTKERFEFGNNWKQFLKNLNNERISNSSTSLLSMLDVENLKDKSFLDIGSGSGLSSLAAKKAGAKVCSYDYDLDSVECTKELKRRYYKNDKDWEIYQGSILDQKFSSKQGVFDIVYSWGVLHHTGDMYKAFYNIDHNVKPNGLLFIAIYNDQRRISRIWGQVKKTYVKAPFLRPFIILMGYFIFWIPFFIIDFLKLKPFKRWKEYKNRRGMSPHHDVVDWMGGYPFEVAKPEDVIHYFINKGYHLRKLKTCGGRLGCVEYVFIKNNFTK